MKAPKRIKLKEQTGVMVGNILLARPFFEEKEYHRAVILLLSHDDTGSTGVILNKENRTTLEVVSPDFGFRKPLYFGGPFHQDQVMFIHNLQKMEGAQELNHGIFVGAEPEALQDLMKKGSAKQQRIRFYNGLVKWAAGQLEYELDYKAWWMTSVPGKELMRHEPADLWSELVISMGHVYGLMGRLEEPGLN